MNPNPTSKTLKPFPFFISLNSPDLKTMVARATRTV